MLGFVPQPSLQGLLAQSLCVEAALGALRRTRLWGADRSQGRRRPLLAETVMLGRPSMMRLPEIIGVRLTGKRQAGITATDMVLALPAFLRQQKVVSAYLEFFGDGARGLSLGDRATISNMTPEFGASAGLFAIDEQTIAYLKLIGRDAEQVALVERGIAGHLDATGTEEAEGKLPDGAVIIAAITSCTNTSNPRSLVAAGLLARKANQLGLARKPWVKSSFAPGSIWRHPLCCPRWKSSASASSATPAPVAMA